MATLRPSWRGLFKPLESAVERACRKDAEADGWTQIKVLKRGWPDRMFLKAGWYVFVEFKREGEKPRPQQAARIAKLQKHGERVLVVDSVPGFVSRLNDTTRT